MNILNTDFFLDNGTCIPSDFGCYKPVSQFENCLSTQISAELNKQPCSNSQPSPRSLRRRGLLVQFCCFQRPSSNIHCSDTSFLSGGPEHSKALKKEVKCFSKLHSHCFKESYEGQRKQDCGIGGSPPELQPVSP